MNDMVIEKKQAKNTPPHPEISVIVPFYNVEVFFEEMLHSLQNQTFNNFEVLLIDDHSRDQSCQLCKKIILEDNRFKLFSSDATGPSAARNVGLRHASAEYIFFADADDTLEHDALEKLLLVAKRNNADYIIGDYSIINNKGEQCRQKKFFDCDSVTQIDAIELLRHYLHKPAGSSPMINVWGRLYRAKVIKNNNVCFCEQLKTWEDTLFNIRFLNTNPKCFYYPKRIYNYFLHTGIPSGCSAIFREPDGYKLLIKELVKGLLKNYLTYDELEVERNRCIVYFVVKTIFQCYSFFYKGKHSDGVQRKELKKIVAHYVDDPHVINALKYYHCETDESQVLPLLLRLKSVTLIDWWCWNKTRELR